MAVNDVLGALGSLKPGMTDFDLVYTYHVWISAAGVAS